MKNIKFLFICLVLSIPCISYSKPLKIENSFGQLVRCGDWKNTPNAVVIRGCPQLGDFLDNDPNPEPTPDPTPTIIPTIVPTVIPTGQPVICEARFTQGSGEVFLSKIFEPGVLTHTCAYIKPTTRPFIEISSVNGSNASCNVFLLQARSPSGVKYESNSVQPGLVVKPEVGTWQIDVTLENNELSLCAKNKPLTIHIPELG